MLYFDSYFYNHDYMILFLYLCWNLKRKRKKYAYVSDASWFQYILWKSNFVQIIRMKEFRAETLRRRQEPVAQVCTQSSSYDYRKIYAITRTQWPLHEAISIYTCGVTAIILMQLFDMSTVQEWLIPSPNVPPCDRVIPDKLYSTHPSTFLVQSRHPCMHRLN